MYILSGSIVVLSAMFVSFDIRIVEDNIHINIPSNKWAEIHSLQSYLFHLVLDSLIEKE